MKFAVRIEHSKNLILLFQTKIKSLSKNREVLKLEKKLEPQLQGIVKI